MGGALLLSAHAVSAELPAGQLLLVRGATVASGSLPVLLSLPQGTFSTNELGILFSQTAFQPEDLLMLSTQDASVEVVDGGAFLPPVPAASFYDPTTHSTVAASALVGGDGGALISLVDGRSGSIDTLLDQDGAVLVFWLPEPAFGSALVVGLLGLLGMARHSRHSD